MGAHGLLEHRYLCFYRRLSRGRVAGAQARSRPVRNGGAGIVTQILWPPLPAQPPTLLVSVVPLWVAEGESSPSTGTVCRPGSGHPGGHRGRESAHLSTAWHSTAPGDRR